jgi:DNA repair exonuclease SbcCD ATPase subunit
MSSIKFKKIRCKNFLSVGNYWFEYNLDQRGASGIIGNNGSGKSLLLDALCFSLYGKAYRGCNKPALINSLNGSDSVVEIEFETMGNSYLIIRGQKPNVFEIHKNGTLLNQDAKAKDYQKFLETNILMMNFKSFTQIIVLGTSNYTPFMELTAADRRDVIEDLLDIQIFSKMRNVLKEYISESNHMLSERDSKIALVNEKIEMQKKHINRIMEKKQEDTQEKREKLEEVKKDCSIIKDEIESLEGQIVSLIESISCDEDPVSSLNELRTYKSKITDNIRAKDDIDDFYKNNTTCPTCKQDIDQDAVSSLIKENIEKKTELESGMSQLLVTIQEYENRVSNLQKVQAEINTLRSSVSSKKGSMDGMLRLVSSLEEDINKTSQNSEDDTEYQKNLDEFVEQLKELQAERVDMVAYKNVLKSAEIMLKDNGIKSKIIKEYLPKMNTLINKYLSALDFFVEFHLDENFKETVKSRHRDEFSYSSFSEGQKFRINIAILFAWRDIARMKNSSHTNILVLDEVFDSSLDDDGIEEFTKLLRAVTDTGVHIMVISHRGDAMVDKFDRVYNVFMDKGFTEMRLTS